MTNNDPRHWMKVELQQLQQISQFRTLTPTRYPSQQEGQIEQKGRMLINLASNDYLGLSRELDADLLANWQQEAEDWNGTVRTGSGASRLIAGEDPVYARFEEEFARFKGTQRCLFFSSGYMANIGIISALMGRHDLVFSDRLNHASMIDGITLSRAQHIRYRHRDMDHLEQLLKQADPNKRKLIVTDTVFSMDGSIAPLQEIVALKERYGALLMVDEAHSGGIFGEQGQGLCHALGLGEQADIQMGTFSKAYGAYGAYAAGDSLLIDYLINKSRSFIYTTALPSMMLMAVRSSWQRSVNEGWRRKTLRQHAAWFRRELQEAGLDTGQSECQIVPLIIGGNEKALRFSEVLQQEGIAAVAVRPPTVPEGSARIRFSLTAALSREQLADAASKIKHIGGSLGIPSES